MTSSPLCEIVAEGFGFPEGPVALPDGSLAFVDLTHSRLRRLDVDTGEVATIADVPGSPNGACLGEDGALYVANNGGVGPDSPGVLFRAPQPIDGCLQRVSLDGEVSTATGELPGPAPHRPNDVCPDGAGGFFFSDPVNWEELYDGGEYRDGWIFRLAADGALTTVAQIPEFPNGLGLEPGSGDLIVAQSNTGDLLRLPRSGDGFGEPEQWVALGAGGFPDGFCWAPDGTLLVSGSISDVIYRVLPDGEQLPALPLFRGADPTNVCIGGDYLWATLGFPGALARIPLEQALAR